MKGPTRHQSNLRHRLASSRNPIGTPTRMLRGNLCFMLPMSCYTLHTRNEFQFVDEGPADDNAPILLLHGMLGAYENWNSTIAAMASAGHRVLAPLLPVYDLPIAETSVSGLNRYLRGFTQTLGISRPILVGNSLGGQVAILYALEPDVELTGLVLTGASGVSEVVMGESRLKRFDREYVRSRAAITFYDPKHASDKLIDDVMDIVADRGRATRLIRMARSAHKEKVEDALSNLAVRTLLIWGCDDRLTPVDVARRFETQIERSTLVLIPECGHAPMLEQPQEFNRLLLEFVAEIKPPKSTSTTQTAGSAFVS